MKIAIVGPSPIPFKRGGIENFMSGLYRTINHHTGHSAELIKIPIREETVSQLLKAYWKFSRLNLDHFDLIISVKYPGWMVKHENHIVYLGHRLRGLYDTYPFQIGEEKLWRSNPFQFPGPWIRRIVNWLDTRAFQADRISHVFCTSHTIAARSTYFNPAMPPTVVYHSTAREDYRCGDGKYLFTINRLDGPKRVDLMIQAFKRVPTDIRFLIGGTGPQEQFLKGLAADDSRIEFLGDVSEDRLIDLYAHAIGVLYTPIAEDYGLITIEAMKSGKPVITTIDSGGPTEFVRHGETGFIAQPDPEDLAGKIHELVCDPEKAHQMGQSARDSVAAITWKNAVNQLLAPYESWPERSRRKSTDRRRILVLVPYPVFPPRSGGQRRVANMYTQLSEYYDIWLLTLDRIQSSQRVIRVNSCLHELRVPPSPIHSQKQWDYEKQVGMAISDVALPELLKFTPNYLRALDYFSDWADIIISSHPYLHPFVPDKHGIQLTIHESHNFEWELKRKPLSESTMGKRLLNLVEDAEKRAVTGSDMIWATSVEEAHRLAGHYKSGMHRFTIAPNGVDTLAITIPSDADRQSAKKRFSPGGAPVALFVGAWHPPNLEAFEFILKTLAPALPNWIFLVVGSVKDQYEVRIGELDLPPNVVVTGEVDESDLDLTLRASDIGLNPMFSGSGTNLKILEYFSAGLPVVTTELGARGLGIDNRIHAFIEPPEKFVDLLLHLDLDSVEFRQIRERAREHVTQSYDWRIIAAHVASGIESCLKPALPRILSMEEDLRFQLGWYRAEQWDTNTTTGGEIVRWMNERSEMIIPVAQSPAELVIEVLGHPRSSYLEVMFNHTHTSAHLLTQEWNRIRLPIPEFFGRSHIVVEFKAQPWSPSETGSGDTRVLGAAFRSISVERSNG